MPISAMSLQGEDTRVAVAGSLTFEGVATFRRAIADLLAVGDRAFVVDLGACEYIDSTGLGALLAASKRITAAGGTLALTGLNDDLRTLFELTRLDTLFTIRHAAVLP